MDPHTLTMLRLGECERLACELAEHVEVLQRELERRDAEASAAQVQLSRTMDALASQSLRDRLRRPEELA